MWVICPLWLDNWDALPFHTYYIMSDLWSLRDAGQKSYTTLTKTFWFWYVILEFVKLSTAFDNTNRAIRNEPLKATFIGWLDWINGHLLWMPYLLSACGQSQTGLVFLYWALSWVPGILSFRHSYFHLNSARQTEVKRISSVDCKSGSPGLWL